MTTQDILEALIRAVFTGEQREEYLADLKKSKGTQEQDTLKTNTSGASSASSTTVRKV